MRPIHACAGILLALAVALTAAAMHEPITCRDTFYVVSATDGNATCGINHDLGVKQVGDTIQVHCSCKLPSQLKREKK